MKLQDQLASKDLVVFLGTGGVGKTTVAAAAALAASKQRKTLVLTIDPARRLADSLGVKLGSAPAQVAPNLDAAMLDTKAALDQLIERYAPTPERFKQILQSRFYEQLSDAFAGSEEFVAMGLLHDLHADGQYDLIVVDTPPSKHAIDFLEVNTKLLRVFESGVVKYLFKPTKMLRVGGGYLAGQLAKWTSAEYLEEVSDFMVTFDDMFRDMEARVRRMQTLLHDRDRSTLNLVTSANEDAVPRTAALHAEITRKLNLKVDAVIVNRYYPRLRGMDTAARLAEDAKFLDAAATLVAQATSAPPDDASAFLKDAARAADFYDAIARENEENIRALRKTIDADFHYVPAFDASVHDLVSLERVQKHLLT